jgi:DNA-binding transcriptional LysR family regulator
MFARLFSTSGLSLDRLRTLVEVGALGSIVKAAGGDPIRQSQFSRQIKELEDFFQIRLVERHGKGIRLTATGRELARISRFFLMGLSNFQRGCQAGEQTFRIGAGPTFIHQFLMPVLSGTACDQGPRHAIETADSESIERRLHELTLDFGVVTTPTLGRPLQTKDLGSWGLDLWVSKSFSKSGKQALKAVRDRQIPLIMTIGETPPANPARLRDREPRLVCDSYLEARVALEQGGTAAILPDFLVPCEASKKFVRIRLPGVRHHFWLAWNPRLLRLNPHAVRERDRLIQSLASRFQRMRSPAP